MLNAPSPEKVLEYYNSWKDKYHENNERGNDFMKFVDGGDQWDERVVTERLDANKESLVFNQAKKYDDKFEAQLSQVEFELDVFPMNNSLATEELNTFKILFKHFLLNDDTTDKIAGRAKKCAKFGYAFAEVNFIRDDHETLNESPTIKTYNDECCGFWDLSAESPTKIDGKYAGIFQPVSRSDLIAKYPNLKNKGWIEDTNTVINFWWREEVPCDFIKLKTGVFKRQDLLTEDDSNNIQLNELEAPIIKKGVKPCVYFQRICNKKVLIKPKEFPTEDLPVVYHPARTYWIDKEWKTFPYSWSLKGAQMLYNYILSQIATISKSVAGQKYILDPTHIQNDQQQYYAQNILGLEGAVVLGNDPGQRELEVIQPPELPVSLLQFAPQLSQLMDQIMGVSMDSQMSDQSVVSGKALSLITHNTSLINTGFIAAHIIFIRDVCKLLKQMLPKIITEQRTILVKQDDSTTKAIVINEVLPSGKIKNNIKDIANSFQYEIDSGPTTEMQRENTIKALEIILNVPFQNPDYKLFKDILWRVLPTPYASELEKCARSDMDPMFLKYRTGDITLEQYQQYMQGAKQKALQQQLQIQSNDPIAKAEDNKAKAMQFDAETKRQSAAAKAATDNAKVNVDMLKAVGSTQLQQAQHAIDISRLQLEQNAEQRETMQQQHDQMIARQQTALQSQQQQQFMQGQRAENLENRDDKVENASLGMDNANG